MKEAEIIADLAYRLTGNNLSNSKIEKIRKWLRTEYSIEGDGLKAFLENNWENRSFLNRFVDMVTTNETYFFREKPVLEDLAEKARRRGKGPLFIWSAAVSTGEEAYSVAMLLQEKGLSSSEYKIVGTDISNANIRKAKEGKYKVGSFTFREMDESYLGKYFVREGNFYKVKDEIKSSVSFLTCNLLNENEVCRLGFMNFDFVLLKNVLIYFSNREQERILANVFQVMKRGGILYTGLSENLFSVKHNFKTVRDTSGITYYVKP